MDEEPVNPPPKKMSKKSNYQQYIDGMLPEFEGLQDFTMRSLRELPAGPSPRSAEDEGYDVEGFNRVVYEVQEAIKKIREAGEVLQIYATDTTGE